MTLFEASIHKLNIPRCVMDDIVAIRNICMEAEEQPPQPAQKQPEQPAPQQAQQTQQQTQQNTEKPQNATQEQPQQNSQQKSGEPQAQGQQPSQDNTQSQQNGQENKQDSQEVPDKIEEDQVNKNTLQAMFKNYLEGCRKKVKAYLDGKFGKENGDAILKNIGPYIDGAEPINFKQYVAPYFMVNGQINQQDAKDATEKIIKFFGLKLAGEQTDTKQQPAQQQGKEQANPQGGQPAQPAK